MSSGARTGHAQAPNRPQHAWHPLAHAVHCPAEGLNLRRGNSDRMRCKAQWPARGEGDVGARRQTLLCEGTLEATLVLLKHFDGLLVLGLLGATLRDLLAQLRYQLTLHDAEGACKPLGQNDVADRLP